MLKPDIVNSRWAQVVAGLVFVVVAFVACKAALSLYNRLMNLRLEARARKKAVGMRVNVKHPVIVRQTDIAARMSALDRQTHTQAEALMAAGKVKEAAKLFESIRFQRTAIDALEKAGFYDDAAAMLLRMNIPHRAAALYERNKMPERAAPLYLQGGQPESAGKIYAALGPAFMEQAVAAYEAAKKPAEVMKILASMLQTRRLVEVCRREGQFADLIAYARERRVQRDVAQSLTGDDFKVLLGQLALTPQNALTLSSWATLEAFTPHLPAMLDYLTRSETSHTVFWQHLAQADRDRILGAVKKSA